MCQYIFFYLYVFSSSFLSISIQLMLILVGYTSVCSIQYLSATVFSDNKEMLGFNLYTHG